MSSEKNEDNGEIMSTLKRERPENEPGLPNDVDAGEGGEPPGKVIKLADDEASPIPFTLEATPPFEVVDPNTADLSGITESEFTETFLFEESKNGTEQEEKIYPIPFSSSEDLASEVAPHVPMTEQNENPTIPPQTSENELPNDRRGESITSIYKEAETEAAGADDVPQPGEPDDLFGDEQEKDETKVIVVKKEDEETVGVVIDRTGLDYQAQANISSAPQPEVTQRVPVDYDRFQHRHHHHKSVHPHSHVAAPTSVPNSYPPGLPPLSQSSYQTTNDSANNPEQIVEERGSVSALYVGKVIGKGGEMIRDLQARSGARIDVDQNVPPGQPRVITYRGSRKTVDYAKMLVQMLSQEGVNESDLPLGQARHEVLIIPAPTVGKVIGRGGEMIRELQSRSHAKIQVDHSGTNSIPPDKKQVTIVGTDQAVIKAKEMILFLVANPMMDALQALNMLVEDKVRGSSWGVGPPYPNFPNQGYNMQPEMMAGGYATSGGYPPATGYSAPLASAYSAPPVSAYGAPVVNSGYPPTNYAPQQSMPPMGTYGQYSAGQVEVDVTYAQKQYMGRIIGQKGVTVNDLQKRSGCDIQINQNVAPGQDCEITIRGTRQGIDEVKRMIREIIEIGPAHPYAGGAEHVMGGGATGGAYGGSGYHQQPSYDYAQTYGGYAPQQQQQQQPAYGHNYNQQAAYDQHTAVPQAYGMPYGQTPQPYGAAAVNNSYRYGGAPVATMSAAGPPPPPPQANVTAWKSATAPDGQIYYYNEATGETTWDKPPGVM